jgi:hypothetical protein
MHIEPCCNRVAVDRGVVLRSDSGWSISPQAPTTAPPSSTGRPLRHRRFDMAHREVP